MSNAWNGAVFAAIANRGLGALKKKLAPLSVFTTDFSAVAVTGNTVTTRIVPASTAQDLVSDLAGDYGAAAVDTSTTAVTVTLSGHAVDGFSLTDVEASQILSGTWSDTAAKLVEQKAYAVAKKVLDAAHALVTNANYGAAVLTSSAANFDSRDVTTIRSACVTAGWDMGDEMASLCLNQDYVGALLDDASLTDLSASGKDAIQSGIVGKVKGFSVVEVPTLPANAENLVGFACRPEAMAIALRPVATQAQQEYLHYEILQDAETGVVMVYAAWFDRDTRTVKHTFDVRYGVQKAVAGAIKRIVSA